MPDPLVRPDLERGGDSILLHIVETVADGILVIDPDRVVTFANAAAERILGVPRSELAGQPWVLRRWHSTLLDGSPVPEDQRADRRALDLGEATFGAERLVVRPDGSRIAVRGNTVPLRNAAGAIAGAVVSITDITDRVRAEEELRRREAYFRALVEYSFDAVALIDADGRFTYLTPTAERLLGYPEEHLLGTIAFDLVHPGDQAQTLHDFANMLANPGCVMRAVTRARRGTGEYGHFEVTACDRRAEPDVSAIVANFRDVTDRELATAALRASEERYRDLFERNLAGVFRSRMDGALLDCNDAFARIFGFDSRAEMIGKNTHEFDRSPDDRRRFAAALLAQRRLTNYESPMRRKDGAPLWLLENVAVRDEGGEVIQEGTVIDITERKRIEEQLRQAHKMEAIGQLAGGIAHDFNNLLTAVIGNVAIAKLSLPADSPARPLLDESEQAGWRAAALTGQLLGFARQTSVRMEPVSLNRVVTDAVKLLRRTIDPRVEIEVRTAKEIGPVLADGAQMHQLLLNLCLNARDAMPDGGRLTVSTAAAPVGAAEAARQLDARPGDYVRLTVADTGHGMTEAVRARMYEPFFTTKEVGKGTGLGLAMVFAVVKRHGGWIDCTSEPGAGTQFDVYLPVASGAASEPAAAEPPVRGGTETVLLADDEPLIRGLTQTVLSRYGYRVLLAEDGAQAVELFRRARSEIHLVVLDISMPKLSGHEALAKIRQLEPRVKVIFASGFTADGLNAAEAAGIAGFINKPFKPADLARAVRAALDA